MRESPLNTALCEAIAYIEDGIKDFNNSQGKTMLVFDYKDTTPKQKRCSISLADGLDDKEKSRAITFMKDAIEVVWEFTHSYGKLSRASYDSKTNKVNIRLDWYETFC